VFLIVGVGKGGCGGKCFMLIFFVFFSLIFGRLSRFFLAATQEEEKEEEKLLLQNIVGIK
jgi:hypothetical protein